MWIVRLDKCVPPPLVAAPPEFQLLIPSIFLHDLDPNPTCFCHRRQMDRKGSAAQLLSSCRGFIFRAIKEPALLSALSSTAYADGGQFDLNLSRSKVDYHLHVIYFFDLHDCNG